MALVNITETFESGTLQFPFQGDWARTTTIPHGGSYCYGSKIGLEDFGVSTTFFEFRTGSSGTLSFYYRISAENNADGLVVNLDGTAIVSSKTSVGWTLYTTTISAGVHTLFFNYIKDGSASLNEDRVYIDDLYIQNYDNTYVSNSVGTLENFEDTNYNFSVQGNINTVSTTFGKSLVLNTVTDGSNGNFIKLNLLSDGIVSFKYCISSELNCDIFYFDIDGTTKLSESGDFVGWKSAQFSLTAGVHVLSFFYVKDSVTDIGHDMIYVDDIFITNVDSYWVQPSCTIEEFEDTTFELPITGNWKQSTDTTFLGTYCYSSSNHTDSSTSTMTLIKTFTDVATISFFYRVSSEYNSGTYGTGDNYHFTINDVEKFCIKGTVGTPWKYYKEILAAGTYTFKWFYMKDGSTSEGFDAAYLDHLIIEGGVVVQNANISSVVGTATFQALNPTALAVKNKTISGVIGTSTYQTLNPTVLAVKNKTISGVVGTATFQALNPAALAVKNVNIASVKPTITFQALNPAALAVKNVNIVSVTATATFQNFNPYIGSNGNIIISSPVITLNTQLPIPNIYYAYKITVSNVGNITSQINTPGVLITKDITISSIVFISNTGPLIPTVKAIKNLSINSILITNTAVLKVPVMTAQYSGIIAVPMIYSNLYAITPNIIIQNKTLNIKISGKWVTVKNIYIKVSGQWEQVDKMYCKVNGQWK